MTPHKLIAWYAEGRIATGEMVSRLCDLAAAYDPATFAGLVDLELLARIRERVAVIPHPDQVIRVGSVCRIEPPDPVEEAARVRAEQERYVAGLQAWKAYFESVGQASLPTGEQP